MKTLVFLMIILAFCTHCTGGSPPSETNEVKQSNTEAASSPHGTTAAQAQKNEDGITPGEADALKVYIDPETGEFTTPPAREVPVTRTTAPPPAFNTSHKGLEERPAPGGGTMVDLEGRFRTPLTATIESNGKTKIEHHVSDRQE